MPSILIEIYIYIIPNITLDIFLDFSWDKKSHCQHTQSQFALYHGYIREPGMILLSKAEINPWTWEKTSTWGPCECQSKQVQSQIYLQNVTNVDGQDVFSKWFTFQIHRRHKKKEWSSKKIQGLPIKSEPPDKLTLNCETAKHLLAIIQCGEEIFHQGVKKKRKPNKDQKLKPNEKHMRR